MSRRQTVRTICPWPGCGGALTEYRRVRDAPSGIWLVFLRCENCGGSHIDQHDAEPDSRQQQAFRFS